MRQPYPRYKETHIPGIEKVPAHWQTRRLKWLAEVSLSNVDKKSEEGQPVVKLCNYVDVYYNENITSDIEFMAATARQEQIDALSLEKGDVLITKDSETSDDIAVPAYVRYTLPGVVCGYHLAHIRPRQDTADGNFLFRSFCAEGIRDQFTVAAHGITRYGISKHAISNSLFLVPPLSEQRAIADYLDRKTAQIEQLIRAKQSQIELLQEQRTALVSRAVTKGLDPNVAMKDSGIEWIGEIPAHWDILPLKHVASLNPETLGENVSPDLEICYVDIGSVETGCFSKSPQVMVFSEAPSRARRIVHKGDTIVSTVRTYLKAMAYIDTESENLIVSTGFAVLSPGPRLFPRYLFYSTMSEPFVDEVCARSVGVGYPAIPFSDLACIQMLVPPVPEQHSIAAYLDRDTMKLDAFVATAEQVIERLQDYRTALISEVVTGKVDVRGLAD